jgi:hypothetical protein
MRVQSVLSVPTELSRRARDRWAELGGDPSRILPGGENTQITFLVPDRDSPDGQALATLARELGASGEGPVVYGSTAIHDGHDLATAPLLLIDAGSLDGAFDARSATPVRACTACGLPNEPRPTGERFRLKGKQFARYDLFRAQLLWFANDRTVGVLQGFKGLTSEPVEVPEGVPRYHRLSASASLGYPVNGTEWGEPCAVCGKRRGRGGGVMGWHVYLRASWNGSDFLVSGPYAYGFFVTRAVWDALTTADLRVPPPGLGAEPAFLLADEHAPEASNADSK